MRLLRGRWGFRLGGRRTLWGERRGMRRWRRRGKRGKGKPFEWTSSRADSIVARCVGSPCHAQEGENVGVVCESREISIE